MGKYFRTSFESPNYMILVVGCIGNLFQILALRMIFGQTIIPAKLPLPPFSADDWYWLIYIQLVTAQCLAGPIFGGWYLAKSILLIEPYRKRLSYLWLFLAGVIIYYAVLWQFFLPYRYDELISVCLGAVFGGFVGFLLFDRKFFDFSLSRRGRRRWLSFKAAWGVSMKILVAGGNVSSILLVLGSYHIVLQITGHTPTGILANLADGIGVGFAFFGYMMVPIVTVSGMFGILTTFNEKRSRMFKEFYREEVMQYRFIFKVNVFTVYFYWIWLYLSKVARVVFSGRLLKTFKGHYIENILENWHSGNSMRHIRKAKGMLKEKNPTISQVIKGVLVDPIAWLLGNKESKEVLPCFASLFALVELVFWVIFLPFLYVVLSPLIDSRDDEEKEDSQKLNWLSISH